MSLFYYRLKQEQTEQRKLEEKLRREEIFRQYQEKKHKEDEEVHRPVVKRERSFRQKTRPQSMYAKPNRGNADNVMHKSQEDLSPNGGLFLCWVVEFHLWATGDALSLCLFCYIL